MGIRNMLPQDMGDVIAIYHQWFDTGDGGTSIMEVAARPEVKKIVITRGGIIRGFCFYMILAEETAVIVGVFVDRDHLRKGYGGSLIDHIVIEHRDRVQKYSVVLRESDIASQRFFTDLDFRLVRVAEGHFRDDGENGHVFEYSLRVYEDKPKVVNRIAKWMK